MDYSLVRGSSTLQLSQSNGFYILDGVEGLDTPPVSLASIDPADLDGSFITNVRYQPRVIVIPLHIQAASAQASRALTRYLASYVNPQEGPVTLRIDNSADSTAQLIGADASDGVDTEWDALNAATDLSSSTTVKRTGARSLKVELASGSILGGAAYLAAVTPAVDRYPIVGGQAYKAAAWFRSDTGTPDVRLIVRLYDADGNQIEGSAGSSPTAGGNLPWVVASDTVDSTTWTEVAATFTPPITATTAAFELAGAVTATATFYVDDITLAGVATYREISGYLSAPLGAGLARAETLGWRRLVLQLTCPDPMFSAPAEAVTIPAWSTEVTVNNPGDALAYPLWDVVLASGYPVTLKNESIPGEPSLSVSDDVLTVRINTDPRNVSVTNYGTGADLWSSISASSTLFPLVPGANVLSGTNISGPLSQVYGSFTPRWLTAW